MGLLCWWWGVGWFVMAEKDMWREGSHQILEWLDAPPPFPFALAVQRNIIYI